MRIERMSEVHADSVLAIYQAGIDEGNATFETTAPTWAEFDRKHLPEHRFVALGATDAVIGWIVAAPVSDRLVYVGVIEHSVYVAPQARRLGVARSLLDAFIQSTELSGIWTIQAGVFPENEASINLHLAAGFRIVGTRERVGRHHGTWRDVVLIERRSPHL